MYYNISYYFTSMRSKSKIYYYLQLEEVF